jgi:hypothetical protein
MSVQIDNALALVSWHGTKIFLAEIDDCGVVCGREAGMNAVGTQTATSVCLSQQPVSPFSPSAFPASLQTSTFRLRKPEQLDPL